MSVLIFNQGTGGKKELAIKLVGGTTQPAGKAGVVWVDTSTAIPKVTWAVAQPSSPAVGDVWVQTDAASANIISMLTLTKTIVRINVLRINQWDGSLWRPKAAYYCNGSSWTKISSEFNPATDVTYTGTKQFIDDGSGHWRVKLLTSGTLKFTNPPPTTIDLFLVGGGGGSSWGGGGGGYTATHKSITPVAGTSYSVVVGAGGAEKAKGGTSSAFGFTAAGGNGGSFADYNINNTTNRNGGNGGSGGGGYPSGNGGSNGGNGVTVQQSGGTGQGSTTREFGATTGTLYAGGGAAAFQGTGGSGGGGSSGAAGATNTGGGAGGGDTFKTGGSGIVVIRSHR